MTQTVNRISISNFFAMSKDTTKPLYANLYLYVTDDWEDASIKERRERFQPFFPNVPPQPCDHTLSEVLDEIYRAQAGEPEAYSYLRKQYLRYTVERVTHSVGYGLMPDDLMKCAERGLRDAIGLFAGDDAIKLIAFSCKLTEKYVHDALMAHWNEELAQINNKERHWAKSYAVIEGLLHMRPMSPRLHAVVYELTGLPRGVICALFGIDMPKQSLHEVCSRFNLEDWELGDVKQDALDYIKASYGLR